MVEFALIAAVIAAAALVVVCVRAYLFLVRAQAALERLNALLGTDAQAAIQSWADAAQGVQRAAGKLEEGLASLTRSLSRVDRVTERLEPDFLAASVIQPAISKVSIWLGGVRKGLAEIRAHRPKGKPAPEGVETEAG
jgi:hypothetical protein